MVTSQVQWIIQSSSETIKDLFSAFLFFSLLAGMLHHGAVFATQLGSATDAHECSTCMFSVLLGSYLPVRTGWHQKDDRRSGF